MIAISTGCPAGIGPEVSVLAAARVKTPCLLVGDRATLIAAARLVGVSERRLKIVQAGPALERRDRRAGKPTLTAGRAALEYIDAAYELVRAGKASALVTAPVSKEAIVRAGVPGFSGHTEWLEQKDRARHAVMCFVAPKGLATSLVTTHLPLAEVPRALTASGVRDATLALAQLLRALGVKKPKIAVASLNPHAGEGELFGSEERRAIAPGIRAATRSLRGRAVVSGPTGAETAYRKANAGELDGVVAMYHDQATIPMKLVAFGSAVNVTVGLGIVRTSVDHGTAYDIAWKGRADPRGMISAIELAAKLSRSSLSIRSPFA
jgi:4-hydroxythreonine-4-phosphate dehydrogenase